MFGFLSPESDHSASQSPSSPKLCYGCKQPIQDEYRLRVSPDLEWHASCLICCACGVNLDENCTCFLKDGKPFCKKDYVRCVCVWSELSVGTLVTCMYVCVCVCVRVYIHNRIQLGFWRRQGGCILICVECIVFQVHF